MNTEKQYAALYEAYEHYKQTGDRHFCITLYKPKYFLNLLNVAQELKDKGYIENVSDKLLSEKSVTFSISPHEPLSFDITSSGINFIKHQRP